MKCLLSVSLVALTVAVIARIEATHPAQALQKGVSVQLAVTGNAAPMPEADNEDAWIVTVTDSGSLYFGVHPVSFDSLAEEMKRQPRDRKQNLYIKADARTPYANVEKVLDAARTALFAAPILLTAQPESPQPETIVLPKGLEVLVGSPAPSASETPVVQVLRSKQLGPEIRIDHERVPWAALRNTLSQLLQNRSHRTVQVQADGQLPFAEVVHVIDACRATGAKVLLITPGV